MYLENHTRAQIPGCLNENLVRFVLSTELCNAGKTFNAKINISMALPCEPKQTKSDGDVKNILLLYHNKLFCKMNYIHIQVCIYSLKSGFTWYNIRKFCIMSAYNQSSYVFFSL